MRHLIIPRFAAAASLLSTAPAYADLGDQLFKLLPNDGAAFDTFGRSVAISGATAIVGAWWDDDNGNQSGSAYLFDTTTGRQIAKLLPNDVAEEDFFGFSVGISGPTAIVGTWWDDDNGTNSGSAYLFNTTTGLQIAKLLPNDGAVFDWFGESVAISGPPPERKSPSLGHGATTTTATFPVRHTSLMLLPARGISTATALSVRQICSRCWSVGGCAKAAPPTSTATAPSAHPTFSRCSSTGGRVREDGIEASKPRVSPLGLTRRGLAHINAPLIAPSTAAR